MHMSHRLIALPSLFLDNLSVSQASYKLMKSCLEVLPFNVMVETLLTRYVDGEGRSIGSSIRTGTCKLEENGLFCSFGIHLESWHVKSHE